VDAKLQLEDFKRLRAAEGSEQKTLRTEFKRKIRQKIDEVRQYIKPEEGTFNFAIMAVPSEAVYYEIIANPEFSEGQDLSSYARAQNVVLVSPSTLWAYLMVIAEGLRGLEFERRASEILDSIKTLSGVARDLYEKEFNVLGSHLRNALGQYDNSERRIRRIKDDLEALERAETQQIGVERVPT
jgi:DNA recombination protein RmuC